MLELRKIDRNNVWQVARLKVKRAQADYVAPTSKAFWSVRDP